MADEIGKIKEIISKHRQRLIKEFQVNEIGIFGSYARGEQKKGSDVDILVKFKKPIGWEFVDLQNYLEKILGKKVDLVTFAAIRPKMRDQIMKEVVSI